jgi:hypothetical protein
MTRITYNVSGGTEKWARNQLYITSLLKKKAQAPNPWNAFLKVEMDLCNAGKQY